VGGIGYKVAVLVQVPSKAIEHAIDRFRELIELIAGAANREALFELARLQVRRCFDDVGEGTGHPDGDDIAGQRRDDHHRRAGDEQNAIEQVDVVLQRNLLKTAAQEIEFPRFGSHAPLEYAMPGGVIGALLFLLNRWARQRWRVAAFPHQRSVGLVNLQEPTAVIVALHLAVQFAAQLLRVGRHSPKYCRNVVKAACQEFIVSGAEVVIFDFANGNVLDDDEKEHDQRDEPHKAEAKRCEGFFNALRESHNPGLARYG
jgi:hypothetical protein